MNGVVYKQLLFFNIEGLRRQTGGRNTGDKCVCVKCVMCVIVLLETLTGKILN